MYFQHYIDEIKELQNLIIRYIDRNEDFQIFNEIIQKKYFSRNQKVIIIFLHMILEIANNHHRSACLTNKIERILLKFKEEIKQTFSNDEIYDFFQTNKRIILFFLNENIITLNESIIKKLNKEGKLYFQPEIQDFLKNTNKMNFDDLEEFQKKRMIGENDSYVCELIRNDSISEFVAYENYANINLQQPIKKSIFETNLFLQQHVDITLIEYATFFGSIKIFNYLKSKNVELTPSLWFYAIHGRNAKIIHILDENQILPKKNDFKKCLIESIKCFHNEMAEYIDKNYFSLDDLDCYSSCLHFYNFGIFCEEINKFFCFYHLCEINDYETVKNFVDNRSLDFDFNRTVIS